MIEVEQRLKDTLNGVDARYWLDDRFEEVHGVNLEKWKPGRRKRGDRILIVPPSQKVFNHFGGDAKEFMEKLIKEIKLYTDRPIEIRPKVGRDKRSISYTVQDQLRSGNYHCIVTYNSIASFDRQSDTKEV